jgi:hypothetical protein
VNGDFEDGLRGWSRVTRVGRPSEPERYRPDAGPIGDATAGIDGYDPHSGEKMYGWSYIAPEDATWTEPREDWKHEVVYQTIEVEPGRPYVMTAWLLTGDRGSGWGRDSRIRLAVDEKGGDSLHDIDTVDQANATQWFATHHQWHLVSLHFTARASTVTVGVQILQWWALQANHLYVDEIRVRPVNETPDGAR